MAPVRNQRNYRKRTNYVIAAGVLVLFYAWLGHYVYTPGDSPPGAGTGLHGGDAGNRITPRSHGLVAGLRKDIPIYTPSRVQTCHLVDPDTQVVAVLRSPSPLEQVSGFYRSAIVANGWTAKEEHLGDNAERAESTVWFRCEKESSLLNVALTGDRAGTEIRLRLLPEPAAAVGKK